MNGNFETGDMRVLTMRVPTDDPTELTIAAVDHVVRVQGPNGYRKEIVLSAEADMERLHAELFHEILELRAPTGAGEATHGARAVPVAGGEF